MDHFASDSEHPKKRRRRDLPPRPVNARVTFDNAAKGDAATVSERLWLELGFQTTEPSDGTGVVYIAISPASPLHSALEDSSWTILPLRRDTFSINEGSPEQQHQIRLVPSSTACQAFLKVLTSVDPIRYGTHLPKSADVRVISALPLTLETVYVSVERGVLEKVDEIQSRFGGGFHNHTKGKKQNQRSNSDDIARQELSLSDRLTSTVREGLTSLSVLHRNDVFELPLPAHPITHVRPAPAIILDCEPVLQGLISAQTKVVVVQAGSMQEKTIKKLSPAPILEESLEDTAEDTTNDQFFSAAEDRHTTTASELDTISEDDSVTEESDIDLSDEESDSMDDIISLSAPGLPPQQAGTLSAMTAATPRPGTYRHTGTHTPGSVYSNFTATTARAGNRPGKIFRTEALLRHIPADLLHPRPGREDDDEAVVMVDTNILAKIGCFSGDWVRIEVARNVNPFGFPSSAFNRLGDLADDEESDWRAVRIYGLSGLLNQKPRYAVDKTGDRRSSFSQNQFAHPTTPAIYLSPVLLANLSNASFVKVGALPKPPKQHARAPQLTHAPLSRNPPFAREVTLLMISTPLTTDMKLQSTLFSALGSYFERKRRILKKGDYIAIVVDTELGKATAQSGSVDTNPEHDDVAVKLGVPEKANRESLDTAWFCVQTIDAEQLFDSDEAYEQNNWGSVAIVDVTRTKLTQSGKTARSIPDTTEAWTKFWLGVKTVPRRPGRAFDPLFTTADVPTPERLPLEKRIADLVAASTSPRAINLGLPPLAILLHSNQRQIGKTYIATSACSSVGLHTFTISCNDVLSENASTSGGGDTKTEALLQMRAERALSCGVNQTALLLQQVDVLTADRMASTLQNIISSGRVLVATTAKIDDVPPGVRSLFSHEFEVGAPDEKARELILRNAILSTSLPLAPTINLKSLALQTAALVAGDLIDVVNRAVLARSHRLLSLATSQSNSVPNIVVSGGHFATHILQSDFTAAISAARSTFSDAIGAPKIPAVTWKDVGGLSSQKDAILETISLPLTRPELFANGIRKRSGILFYGPPGTGKTLLAKAIATEFSLNFFSVKGPELLNMYIGESEANVRRVFQKARDARPCVVFFDELDSVAPKRGNQGDSGGVMDRIVSQLLAELDGMSGGGSQDSDGNTNNAGGVFVIGATNRPDLLDPALLRPGRFDKMLYLGVADSHDSQVTIMEALTRKFTLDPSVDLRRIAEKLPFTYTGADLYALCSDAMLKAITRKTRSVDDKVKQLSEERGENVSTNWFFDHVATKEDIVVVVNEDDFRNAQKELVGSVSAKELEHFERIRGLFEEQDIGHGMGGKKKPTSEVMAIRPAADATPIQANDVKGKGKQRESTSRSSISKEHNSTNSNLKTEDEQNSANDYGFPSYMNGSTKSSTPYSQSQPTSNGDHNTTNNSHNDIQIKSKGKGKEKATSIIPHQYQQIERDVTADGFTEDLAGENDEDLYD